MIKRIKIDDGESRTELCWRPGDDDAFLSILRVGEQEDEDRVALVSRQKAIKLAAKLLEFAVQKKRTK